jgi:hypothetical protein
MFGTKPTRRDASGLVLWDRLFMESCTILRALPNDIDQRQITTIEIGPKEAGYRIRRKSLV